MHWVIDRIISGEPSSEKLLHTLKTVGSDVTLVRKPPFADYVVGLDSDVPLTLDIDGPVFVTGSTGMSTAVASYSWNPGYIDAPSMDEAISHWGNHMLNAEMVTGRIDSIAAPSETSFIRPVDDGKSFAGIVLSPEEFEDFRYRIMSIDGWTNLPPSTMVAVAPLKHIISEWRCLVVDGELVTGCRYRHDGRIQYVAGLPSDVAQYVQDRAQEWNPRCAYIMDVAATDKGLRIIETNSVSSAGFYALDIEKYVDAINSLA